MGGDLITHTTRYVRLVAETSRLQVKEWIIFPGDQDSEASFMPP
jgi:hypothetical protein